MNLQCFDRWAGMLIIGLLTACGEPDSAVPTVHIEPIQFPETSRLDWHGREQLAGVDERLRALAGAAATDRARGAIIYGDAGQDYQAYGFEQAANA